MRESSVSILLYINFGIETDSEAVPRLLGLGLDSYYLVLPNDLDDGGRYAK